MTDQELLSRLEEVALEHEVDARLREKGFDEFKQLAEDTRKELSRMPWVVVSLTAALVVIGGAGIGAFSFFFGG